MGGDVTLESEVGKGTTFHVSLPMDCRDVISTADGAIAPHDGTDELLVLSVDDDPSVAPLLRKMLADHGYAVVASSSARSAVADAKRHRPAAIILDILNTDRGGEDILRELKADPATSGIPVIVLSVIEPADVPSTAEAHVGKPIRKEALLRALAQQRPTAMEPG